MKQLLILTLLLVRYSSAVAQELKIVDRPIVFDSTRVALSLEYLEKRHGIETNSITITPKIIVVHWTAIPTLEQSFRAFNPPKLPESRTAIKSASQLNVSAHFLVDRDGTIYRLMPENYFARHVIGLNYCSIGIENVANGDDLPLTKQQFEANVQLIDYLVKKYPIQYLIGHDQYKRFIDTELWRETDPNYLTEKQDVGELFIEALHKEIKQPLKPAPDK
jgi:N-acetyl-anhydromuramyl-L-alanine amidase AmpD